MRINYKFFQRLAALNPRAAAIYAQGGQYPSMSEEEIAHNTVVRDMYTEAQSFFELYSIPAPATRKLNIRKASQAYHEAREAFVRKANELLQKISFEEAQALNEYLERRWRKIHARETAIVYASNNPDAYLERRERRDAWWLYYKGDRHYFYVRLYTLSARNIELKVFEQPNRVVFFVTAPQTTAATEWVDGRWQPWRENVSLGEAIASNRQGDMIFTTCPEEKFFPSLLPFSENLTSLPAVLGASGQEYSWVRKANLVAQHNPQKTRPSVLVYPYVVIPASESYVVLEHEDHPALQISRPAPGDWVVEAAPVGGHTQYRPHGWGED